MKHQQIASPREVQECVSRYPVKVRGISLYALWDSREKVVEVSREISEQGIGVYSHTFGLWTVRHFKWQPRSNTAETPLIRAAETVNKVIVLQDRLHELYATNMPLYLMFHIEELITPKRPLLYVLYGEKKKKTFDKLVDDMKDGFLECIQQLCDLDAKQMVDDWLPNKFRHYDQESQRLGWLVISPSRALLADVDQEQIETLASLLQPYYTNRNRGPGILSERYPDMLVLIMQWVSNQDTLQAVDQMNDLVVSGTKAIDGQVWLNFAIAGIGILVALLLVPEQKPHTGQFMASVGCLGVASFWFWWYARKGLRVFLFIGWLCCLAILPCFLAWPQVISLFQAVMTFFSRLK